MREQGLREVDADTAEEEEAVGRNAVSVRAALALALQRDAQKWNPGDVLDERVEEIALAEAIFE